MQKIFLLFVLSILGSSLQSADARSEDDMFGGSAVATETQPSEIAKEEDPLEASTGPDAFASGETKDDPLDIGGTLYQRASSTFYRGLTEGEQPLNLPLQFDAYLDSRPNDRVRGYIGARLLYDSAKDAYGKGAGGGFVVPGAVTVTPLPNNPQVVLDQAWLKFDIDRTAFVSLGKQHVKWGSGRIWNPSDALNPQRRDPLQPYDLRLGSNMLSVQLPWEAKQANLYAIALLDNPQPASTLQQVGGALRVEGLLGPAEIGLSAVGRPGLLPRYGADLSSPLGPFDAHVEAAFISNDGSLGNYEWKGIPSGVSPTLQSLYAFNKLPGSALQIVGGLDYTWNWRENRSATIGAEYFYNELGVTDGALYPILLYLGAFTPFYLGKHYSGVFARFEGPDSGNKTSYTLSSISNLNDLSAVTRLDFSWLLLEYLSFGMYGSANYGGRGGEFNFMLDTPALTYNGVPVPPVRYDGVSGEAGMSLRMAF